MDYDFITMEPSFKRWTEDEEDARRQIRAGFRNFIFSYEDFILHYAIRKFLCDKKEKYYLTDLSKGAMSVRQAKNQRVQRYLRWLPLLREEIDLISTRRTQVICVGRSPHDFLARHGEKYGLHADHHILHYSPNAAAYRMDAVRADPQGFKKFRKKNHGEELQLNAKTLLNKYNIPERFKIPALVRVHPENLTPSRIALLFTYMRAFEGFRANH